MQALLDNHVVGISTGGVAEIFEQNAREGMYIFRVNADSAIVVPFCRLLIIVFLYTGHEAIVLQDRKGLVKLAIRTGAALVPCYLFGNTKLYSMWYGGDDEKAPLRRALRWISRKLGAYDHIFKCYGISVINQHFFVCRIRHYFVLGTLFPPHSFPYSYLWCHGEADSSGKVREPITGGD